MGELNEIFQIIYIMNSQEYEWWVMQIQTMLTKGKYKKGRDEGQVYTSKPGPLYIDTPWPCCFTAE